MTALQRARQTARKALESTYEGRAMYQCGACGKLESRLAVTVKAPVRVPILQRCDCGATMRRIRSGKAMVCPACREPMQKTDIVAVVMWD